MSEHICGQARKKTRVEEFFLLYLKLTYFLWFVVGGFLLFGFGFFPQALTSDSDRD